MAHTTTPSAFGGDQSCGCCTPATAHDALRNPPGLTTISHRAGSYGTYLHRMLTALADQPGLRGLTTRDTADPLVALLEAWASVAEVLSFQHEQFAQEGYLSTAATRDAVQLHARALGYELRPGVAAHTHLVFGLDLPHDADDTVTLPPGTAVQSVPGDGEQPQVFETVVELVAHRDLDGLQAARVEATPPGPGATEVVLAGTASGVAVGDRLLLVAPDGSTVPADDRWDLVRVAEVEAVEADPQDPAVPAHTVVTLEEPASGSWPASAVEVHALRVHTPLFGNAAMAYDALPLPLRVGERHPEDWTFLPGPYADPADWVDGALDAEETELDLARRVDGVVAESWAVLEDGTTAELVAVTAVREANLSGWLLTAEGTTLTIEGSGLDAFTRRSATVWCASEPLELGVRPRRAPVEGTWLQLDRKVTALPAGREIVVEGERTDGTGWSATVTMPQFVCPATDAYGDPATSLVLVDELPALDRASVRIHANVAVATHGQSRSVVLGSGDGSCAHQAFLLPEPDVTHVPTDLVEDPTPLAIVRGAASSLTVRVDGRPWEQVQTLHGQPPGAEVYTARARPGDARAVVTFGDGVHGARLPSGTDNVTATYRVGTGLAGEVAAEQLSVLLSRPLGLSTVRNPLPASGGANPELLGEARRNAPVAVRTLDRLVSLADVADLARAHAGVGKAAAAWVWLGHERVVHVTIAPADGAVLAPDDPLLGAVREALDSARHPGAPLVVAPHVDVPVALAGGVVMHPDHDPDAVLAAATTAVAEAFSFPRRDLATPLAASEVVAVLHEVRGLVAVDVDAFHAVGEATEKRSLVPARPARVELGVLQPAELARLDPAAIDLTEVTS